MPSGGGFARTRNGMCRPYVGHIMTATGPPPPAVPCPQDVYGSFLSPMDPSQEDGRIPTGPPNNGATNFAANPLAFRLAGSSMPASFPAGPANCVFFATVFAGCTPPGGAAAPSGHQWANYNH